MKANKQLRKMRKAKPADSSQHHIIPKSKDGENTTENVVYVNKKKHVDYHRLFGNMLPDEVVVYLVDTFFGGDWSWVSEAKRRAE